MKLIVIRGTSAVGKTTIARQLAQNMNYTHIEVDQFERQLPYTTKNNELRWKSALKNVKDGNYIVEGNHFSKKLHTYIKKKFPNTLFYHFKTSFVTQFKRNLSRPYKLISFFMLVGSYVQHFQNFKEERVLTINNEEKIIQKIKKDL